MFSISLSSSSFGLFFQRLIKYHRQDLTISNEYFSVNSSKTAFISSSFISFIISLLFLFYISPIIVIFIVIFGILGFVIPNALSKKLIVEHTLLNKFTGVLLFLLPFTLVWVDLNYSALVVCVVATISVIQEGCYIIKGREIIWNVLMNS